MSSKDTPISRRVAPPVGCNLGKCAGGLILFGAGLGMMDDGSRNFIFPEEGGGLEGGPWD